MLANKNIEDFVAEILKEKNSDLKDVSTEVFEQLKKDLVSRLEDRINVAILSKLPENKLDDFEKVLDEGDQDKMQKFLTENVSDLETVVALELINFRKLYLA